MIISAPYHDLWLSKDGTTTPIKALDDHYLVTVLLHIDRLVRLGWQYDKPEVPIAANAPDYVHRGMGRVDDNLRPDAYWNARMELQARNLI